MTWKQKELEAVEFPTLVNLISGFAKTRQGKRRLGGMYPWDNLAGVRRLRQIELESAWILEPSSMPVQPFDEALDELLTPVGWLLPEHWRQLREALKSLKHLIDKIASLPWPEAQEPPQNTNLEIDRLQIPASILADPSSIADMLARSFNDEGQLEPLKIPALADLHKKRMRAYQQVQNRLLKFIKDTPEAFMEATVVERSGRFCLPVRLDRKGLIPGLVLDRSGSGATAFLEPFDAVQLNNEYMEADSEYNEAVNAYLRGLLDSLRSRMDDFIRWHEFLTDVDEIIALLQWSRLCDGILPDLRTDSLALQGACHPLLMPGIRAVLELEPIGHDVVPLDLTMNRKRPGLVISGSNTGGKTVVLKTVGLLTAMAHCGCAVPAKPGSEFPPLSSFHADIGDHQTLIGSLSTFSSHIMHLRRILGQARPSGFVLLDELGTGTDPKEGAALGIAILQALSRRSSWVLCSTHLGEISQWALRHSRFQNASVQFDEERLVPTYRLLLGLPGQSRAITIAAKLGMPKSVLEQAQKSLGRREQDWREFLRQLEAERGRLLEESDELARVRAALEKDKRILADRETQLKHQQDKFREESQTKLARVLEFADHESKRLIKDLKAQQKAALTAQDNADRVGVKARERVKNIEAISRQELTPMLSRADASESKSMASGMYAKHRGLGVHGKITSIKGKKAILEISPGRRLEVHVGELEPAAKVPSTTNQLSGRTRVRADYQEIDSELNLIGRASDDVEFELHRFVESALASGYRFIRIVHGHGTGRLKTAVREVLNGHPNITSIEDAPQAQGGSGATVVVIR
ncbi:MAG: Smr/MutS family protein [Holophagales bacterium]|jgi:DNA mismatch repair protein MutS2|nr:Smr/MutS family protein [Holophagales bacterium]